ncbi:MAG: STAS domain-containing protein [Oxalobacteraceae bacterium]
MFQLGQSLVFSNASAVLAQGLQALARQQSVIDMAALTSVDSSAVAVLLAWQRAASAHGQALTLQSVPANLRSLIALYDVAQLLPVAVDETARHR